MRPGGQTRLAHWMVPLISRLKDCLQSRGLWFFDIIIYTVEYPSTGRGRVKYFTLCFEVVASLEVEMYGQLMTGGN